MNPKDKAWVPCRVLRKEGAQAPTSASPSRLAGSVPAPGCTGGWASPCRLHAWGWNSSILHWQPV